MKSSVIVFPGSNCDRDIAVALEKFQINNQIVCHNETNLPKSDLVILPGGFEAPDRVRLLTEVQEFVREMDEQKKLVAAICHGPWIMISAEICKGRKMTAFWSIEADLRNAGADYQHKAPLVIDGNFITSPHYNNNGDFMKAVVEYLNK